DAQYDLKVATRYADFVHRMWINFALGLSVALSISLGLYVFVRAVSVASWRLADKALAPAWDGLCTWPVSYLPRFGFSSGLGGSSLTLGLCPGRFIFCFFCFQCS